MALSPLRSFGQVPSYSPNRLVSKSAMLKERHVQGCKRAKHKTYSPLDDHWVILSTSKAFDYIRTSLVCRLDHRRRPGERFLEKHILETIFHEMWIKAQSMT